MKPELTNTIGGWKMKVKTAVKAGEDNSTNVGAVSVGNGNLVLGNVGRIG
jgi:hypothetical protein